LNIVGVRKNSTESNSFNDIIYIFFKDQSTNWQGYKPAATTEEDKKWLNVNTPEFTQAIEYLKNGGNIEAIEKKYNLAAKTRAELRKVK